MSVTFFINCWPYKTVLCCHESIFTYNCIISGFSKDKVPEKLDAIVIGSGIGGLTTAAIMSGAGKKVLVLEQHDQVGSLHQIYENCIF